MSKLVQFLITNVLAALWGFIVKKINVYLENKRYNDEKKKIEQAAVDIKKKELKYRANKSLEGILKGKK